MAHNQLLSGVGYLQLGHLPSRVLLHVIPVAAFDE
jgi:hypothetical protein